MTYSKIADSTALSLSFKFETYNSKVILQKASRILTKQIIEEKTATQSVYLFDLWEQSLSISRELDFEAEQARNAYISSNTTTLK